MVRILAIETSCDDTSVGIIRLENQTFFVDTLLAYSQIQDHQKYGGVVPEIASRLHSEKIIPLLEAVGLEKIKGVDAIAVTTHPGLPWSLLIGKTSAHFLAQWLKKPLYPVNHIHGHIFSTLLERSVNDIQFPYVVLSVSGGHNDLYIVEEAQSSKDRDNSVTIGPYTITKLWWTRDDAAGECFDKVSRMLGGPYPGGARISEQASKGNPDSGIVFKRIFLDADGYDFSFSWMKSQIHYFLEEMHKNNVLLDAQKACDIAYAFQEAVVEVLAKKLVKTGVKLGAKTLGIVGGVSANKRLFAYAQDYMQSKNINISLLKPVQFVYSTDNAAMIGAAALVEHHL